MLIFINWLSDTPDPKILGIFYEKQNVWRNQDVWNVKKY